MSTATTVCFDNFLKAAHYKRWQTRFLKRFSDDAKCELLLVIITNEHRLDWGIAKYVDALSTSPQSDTRMNRFLREMIQDGGMEIRGALKPTTKHLFASSVLRAELEKYLRLIAGIEMEANVSKEEYDALLEGFLSVRSGDKIPGSV